MTEIQEGSKVARVVEAAGVLVQGPIRLVVSTYADNRDPATGIAWEQYDELTMAVKALRHCETCGADLVRTDAGRMICGGNCGN